MTNGAIKLLLILNLNFPSVSTIGEFHPFRLTSQFTPFTFFGILFFFSYLTRSRALAQKISIGAIVESIAARRPSPSVELRRFGR